MAAHFRIKKGAVVGPQNDLDNQYAAFLYLKEVDILESRMF
jgi:hypothetical protein